VLAAALPGLHFVWLRRADKIRQAISWWRADATGQYALTGEDPAAEPPGYDRAAVDRLVSFAAACDAGWQSWFTAHAIQPLQLWYEDVSQDPDAAVRTVAAFLNVPLPDGLPRFHPRTRQQADEHTERLVTRYQVR
jgi:LPS sulfotransferase NodH